MSACEKKLSVKSPSRADVVREVVSLLSTDEEEGAVRRSREQKIRLLMGVSAKKSGGASGQTVVTLIAGGFSTSISKAAATAATITLTASSFTDFSAYTGLYDEVTLISGEVWCNYDQTGMSSTTSIAGAFAWDPVDATAATNSNDLICYRCHYGPFLIPVGNNALTGNSWPLAYGSVNGFYHMQFVPVKMGKSGLLQRPELAQQLTPVNAWLPVQTSGLNFGYLKLYLNNPGATNAGSFGVVCRVKVAFRLRNG